MFKNSYDVGFNDSTLDKFALIYFLISIYLVILFRTSPKVLGIGYVFYLLGFFRALLKNKIRNKYFCSNVIKYQFSII